MYEVAASIVAFTGVIAAGGVARFVARLRRQGLQRRLQGLSAQPPTPAGPASSSAAGTMLQAVGRTVSAGKTSRSLRENLACAGYYEPGAASVFLGAKMVLLLAGLLALPMLLWRLPIPWPLKAAGTLMGAGLMFFIPNIVIDRRREKRARQIRQHLPDAVDLLEICVSAGLSLEMAWNTVADEIGRVCPHLGDEMALANLEIHLGATRAQAMRHMADRTKVEQLSSLVAVIVQSEKLGTSVAEALRTFTTYMRDSRGAMAEEAAERMAVKLLMPMIVFIFPAVFIVLVGPAALRLFYVMSGQ